VVVNVATVIEATGTVGSVTMSVAESGMERAAAVKGLNATGIAPAHRGAVRPGQDQRESVGPRVRSLASVRRDPGIVAVAVAVAVEVAVAVAVAVGAGVATGGGQGHALGGEDPEATRIAMHVIAAADELAEPCLHRCIYVALQVANSLACWLCGLSTGHGFLCMCAECSQVCAGLVRCKALCIGGSPCPNALRKGESQRAHQKV